MENNREKSIKKNNIDLYNNVISYNIGFENISWTQKLYNYNNQINEYPKCLKCGNNVNFKDPKTGYRKFCSNYCHLTSESTKQKRDDTKLKIFGDVNYNNREKFKETNLLRYGNEIPQRSKVILNKIKQTNLERYGFTSPIMNNEIYNKSLITKEEKYGDINYNNREKAKITLIEKYGVDSPIKVNEIREKMEQTNINRYGVENVFESKEMINKLIEINKITFIKRWSKKLKLQINDINVSEEIVTIRNYCKKHNEFILKKKQLYDRYKSKTFLCSECTLINKQSSIGEIELKNFIIDDLKQISNKIRIYKQEIDVYIPEHSIGIEYNGLYWHSELYKDNDYHINKTNFFKQQNIELIHIFEDEWKNKKEIIKNLIKDKLKLINNEIDSNLCDIRIIKYDIAENFVNNNHIEGWSNTLINLGLLFNNELISIMCFNEIDNYKYIF